MQKNTDCTKTRKPFLMIPWKQTLKGNTKTYVPIEWLFVYPVLLYHSKNNVCFPSQELIGLEAGIRKEHVALAISGLEKKNWIKVYPNKRMTKYILLAPYQSGKSDYYFPLGKDIISSGFWSKLTASEKIIYCLLLAHTDHIVHWIGENSFSFINDFQFLGEIFVPVCKDYVSVSILDCSFLPYHSFDIHKLYELSITQLHHTMSERTIRNSINNLARLDLMIADELGYLFPRTVAGRYFPDFTERLVASKNRRKQAREKLTAGQTRMKNRIEKLNRSI